MTPSLTHLIIKDSFTTVFFSIVTCTCTVIILTCTFWYNWSIHAFVFRGIDRYSNVNENGRDSHMVYELDELLFRVYMCSNIFVRTHFLFCFIKANNGFVQLIYIQLLNFDSRLIISSYSLCFVTIENFRFT